MVELYNKAYELYKEFENQLPDEWYNIHDEIFRSREIQFEACCDGWLSYGLRFIADFDNIILLICRYSGGECGAYSVLNKEEIYHSIEKWIEDNDVDEDSINFEFTHLYDEDDEEKFMNYICPIIREQIYARELKNISASEVDDIARDLWLEIDLDELGNEEYVCDLIDEYFETYPGGN